MKILSAEDRVTKRGPQDWFTGTVWVDEIAVPPAPARQQAYRVSFEPGARTAWHTHPLGQVIHNAVPIQPGAALSGQTPAPSGDLPPARICADTPPAPPRSRR